VELVFSRMRVLRGRDFLPRCRNRPVFENRVKFDSHRLHQPSLASGSLTLILGERRLGRPFHLQADRRPLTCPADCGRKVCAGPFVKSGFQRADKEG